MQCLLREFRAKIRNILPNLPTDYITGASREEILQFERETGIEFDTLPEDLLRFYNFINGDPVGIFIGLRALSLEQVSLSLSKEPYWPLLWNHDEQFLGIDTTHGPTYGKIMIWGPYFPCPVLFGTLIDFMTMIIEDLGNSNMYEVDSTGKRFTTHAEYMEFVYFDTINRPNESESS